MASLDATWSANPRPILAHQQRIGRGSSINDIQLDVAELGAWWGSHILGGPDHEVCLAVLGEDIGKEITRMLCLCVEEASHFLVLDLVEDALEQFLKVIFAHHGM